MDEMKEAQAALLEQLVETEIPAQVEIIDRKLAVLKKYQQ